MTNEKQFKKNVTIKSASNVYIQPDGTLACIVELEDRRRVPFVGNKLLEEIGGKRIIDVSKIYTQPDIAIAGRSLAGQVYLEDGRWVNFLWDGERVLIT